MFTVHYREHFLYYEHKQQLCNQLFIRSCLTGFPNLFFESLRWCWTVHLCVIKITRTRLCKQEIQVTIPPSCIVAAQAVVKQNHLLITQMLRPQSKIKWNACTRRKHDKCIQKLKSQIWIRNGIPAQQQELEWLPIIISHMVASLASAARTVTPSARRTKAGRRGKLYRITPQPRLLQK